MRIPPYASAGKSHPHSAQPGARGPEWWQHFFESPDAFEVGMFPTDEETEEEVAGLMRFLRLEPGQTVADICCGAGRHLVRLAARGMRLVGVDASAMMLRCTRQAITQAGVSADLVRSDARRLPLASGTFDAVLNMFNSFGYLSDEENEQMLAEMARCVKPGGLLFVDTRNRQFQILFAPYHSHTELPDGTPAIVRSSYSTQTKRMDTTWCDPVDEDTVFYRASIRLYGLEELDEMLARLGMEKVAVYGTYDGEPFEGFHRQLLYVARKPG